MKRWDYQDASATKGSGMNALRKSTKAKATDDKPVATSRKDEAWDDRLRRVGDANYVAVEWSGRDEPNWPLPQDSPGPRFNSV
jgi:hypothetical protein